MHLLVVHSGAGAPHGPEGGRPLFFGSRRPPAPAPAARFARRGVLAPPFGGSGELDWLLDELVHRVREVRHAVVLSNDGLAVG
ncbi:roadblock/LC7 domain-containing protein, partial [Streptomyces sp. NPDC093224]|uniref:roadblock/LC7 domain-containing protein n=1 Tax=Streptomyces sp. NPDC093224 TaxID=3155198 RepID=UPI003431EC15